jgi:hypothetical protein
MSCFTVELLFCMQRCAAAHRLLHMAHLSLPSAAALCRTTKALSDKLFAQLDFDGSGGISFKEFLIGLEKMVMEEFDDEDGEVRQPGCEVSNSKQCWG